jgi:hypothetical protein
MRWFLVLALSICLISQVDTSGQTPQLSQPKAPGKQLPGGVGPRVLHLYIGGFPGSYFWVNLEGDHLSYRARRNVDDEKGFRYVETKKTIKPTAEQWRQFWKVLDEAQAWQWSARYPAPPQMADGTQWSVEMEWDGRRIKSSGDKNFPGKPSPEAPFGATETFRKLLTGVKALLGGEDFQ